MKTIINTIMNPIKSQKYSAFKRISEMLFMFLCFMAFAANAQEIPEEGQAAPEKLTASNPADSFQEMGVHLDGDEQTVIAEQPFNAMVLFSPSGVDLPEVSYKTDRGGWKKWEHVHAHDKNNRDMLEMIEFDSPRTEIMVSSSEEMDVKFHFYLTIEEKEEVVEQEPDQLFITGKVKPRFVSREEWLGESSGQKTDLFVLEDQTEEVEYNQSARVRAKLIEPKEYKKIEDYSDENIHFDVGSENTIPRITVHHTVTPQANITNAFATVRSIYMFHTYTRGWGDIGYHYLISPEGLIFEGAKNGPTKSGTHVANRNFNNIGISLMGNFEIEEPTAVQLEVLSLLVADHAVRFGIDPDEVVTYFGQDVERVAGHKDIASKFFPTACPGKNLHNKLPDVRKRVEEIKKTLAKTDLSPITTRDRLMKSAAAPQVQGRIWTKNLGKKKGMPLTVAEITTTEVVHRGLKGEMEIIIRNNTGTTLPAGSRFAVSGVAQGTLMTDFLAIADIAPSESGAFRAKYLVKTTPNGRYEVTLTETFLQSTDTFADNQKTFRMSLQVSGDKNFLFSSSKGESRKIAQSAMKASVLEVPKDVLRVSEDEEIKIKLKFFKERYGDFIGSSNLTVFKDGVTPLFTAPAGVKVKVMPMYDEDKRVTWLKIVRNDTDEEFFAKEVQLQTVDPMGHIEIANYDKGLGPSHAYNLFRNRFNLYAQSSTEMLVVNQLPIKLYMRGLAEEPSTEPLEKKKAIHVLAQSYAWVYSQTPKRKFNTEKYDLEDDPATSQYYLGYEWEKYHADQIEILNITEGEVIAVDGVPVIGPYHSCSGGNTSDKWRSAYPHTKAQYLSYDEDCAAAGHGVGLSGFTAKALANQGYTYKEILDFFYSKIDIIDVY